MRTRQIQVGNATTRRRGPSWRRLWVRGRRLPFDPWKLGLTVALTVAVVVVLGWVLLGSRLLVIRQLQVVGERLVGHTQIVEATGVRLGSPLVRVDTGVVERRVERIRQVESARVERAWPSTLRITVTERTPIAVQRMASGYRLYDRFGVMVAVVSRPPAGMPFVEFADDGLAGSPARAALAVVDVLPADLADKVVKVSASHLTEVTLHLEDGATVVWGGPERSAEKARTLAVLMKRDADVYDVSSPEVATTR